MKEFDFYALDWLDVEWTHWGPLDPDEGHISRFSANEGIYRIRHQDRSGLEYIGETGRSLRGRVQSLARGTFADEMPFRDPHTAAPCLWAVREEYGPNLEVSVATPELAIDKQSRKSFEEALIAVYRREFGESPTANFGRIIDGYQISTYRRGEFRGGPLPDGETEPHAEPGVAPLNWQRSDDVLADDWMGLDWSTPVRLEGVDSSVPTNNGLYRIWNEEGVPPLEYIGQSANLRSRLRTHRNNRDSGLLFSYATLEEHDPLHKRAEVETDLLGAHWLMVGSSPRDQF